MEETNHRLIKKVYCRPLSFKEGDIYNFFVFSSIKNDKIQQNLFLKTDRHKGVLSDAIEYQTDEYGGGMGWRTYKVPHSFKGNHDFDYLISNFQITCFFYL